MFCKFNGLLNKIGTPCKYNFFCDALYKRVFCVGNEKLIVLDGPQLQNMENTKELDLAKKKLKLLKRGIYLLLLVPAAFLGAVLLSLAPFVDDLGGCGMIVISSLIFKGFNSVFWQKFFGNEPRSDLFAQKLLPFAYL